MSQKANLWSWKDSEIQGELDRLKIKLETYNRKAAIDAIKLAAVKGEVKETQEHVQELKDNGIDLRRVIFHSIGEQDIPCGFVGLN